MIGATEAHRVRDWSPSVARVSAHGCSAWGIAFHIKNVKSLSSVGRCYSMIHREDGKPTQDS